MLRRGRWPLWIWLLALGTVACSSGGDPSKLLGAPGYRASAPSASGSHPGSGTGASAPSPPSEPPPSPPTTSPTPYADGGPTPPTPTPPSDAGAPSASPPGSCGNPKCGTSADGCGCAAQTDQGDVVFLGCDDQGCVCGQGQNVDQSFAQTGACDSDTAMLAAWQMCTCP